MPPKAPTTLDAVLAVADPDDRAQAADLYLDRLVQRCAEVRSIRDAAIRASSTPAPALATHIGCSVAAVKAARSSARRPKGTP